MSSLNVGTRCAIPVSLQNSEPDRRWCVVRIRRFLIAALIIVSASCGGALAENADWPMWRYDSKRSAASPHALPPSLELKWVMQQPPLRVAWPGEPRMTFDAGYEPVVCGTTLFVGSSRNDRLTAVDTETGSEQWRFYADGPIRFAPVTWRDRVFVVSDDGRLYCLDARTGSLKWKIRGGPTDRKLLGNERLISMWPARGGPVLADGVLYFAASIWPMMGTFIYALDADSGRILWLNDSLGSIYINQPHNSPAFAGPAPQGHMALAGDRLLVSAGRSVPACLDTKTGKLLYYQLAKNGKLGGHLVAVEGQWVVNNDWLFTLAAGDALSMIPPDPVLSGGIAYACSGGSLQALDLAHLKTPRIDEKDKRKTPSPQTLPILWKLPLEKDAHVFIKAGPRLYGGHTNTVWAVDIPQTGGKPRVSWQGKISGKPHTAIAAAGKLFVVAQAGTIYCFGQAGAGGTANVRANADANAGANEKPSATQPSAEPDRWDHAAESILKAANLRQGYALVLGVDSGRLLESLARRSELHLIGLDPSADRVNRLRRRLDDAGLYGHRVALLTGDTQSVPLPPFLATLIVSEDTPSTQAEVPPESIARMFESLRPYGGIACLPISRERREAFSAAAARAKLQSARLGELEGWVTLTREGPLPGSANWTHLYGDVANTCISPDRRVKAPLGPLWFTNASGHDILPRHGHGPTELIVDGRLFLEGPNIIRAIDVYTGRRFWEANLPGIGEAYDNTAHQPGANGIGSNYVAASDGIYVAYGERCLRLDPASGRQVSDFRLPEAGTPPKRPRWSMLRISGDLLVATAEPVSLGGGKPGRPMNWDDTSSKQLLVLDRHSGKVLWTFTAAYALRHNAICIGAGKVFCIDRYPEAMIQNLQRRGKLPPGQPAMYALDLRTGSKLWTRTESIFGTWLSYSEPHDALLQAGRPSRDSLPDEPSNQMIVHRGKDGSVVWDRKTTYMGPCMIHGRTIIMQGTALDLLTGEPKMRSNPLTGEEIPWKFTRNHGCNTAIGSEYLLTFRSAAAAYYDLVTQSGTGNFGGFRSGCTSNLIAADGVLNAPDYTNTCTCSYQNQTSIALVHMPEVETWSFNDFPLGDKPIQRMGINLGAPGDRLASINPQTPKEVLWLEYPRVGGPSPLISITHEPADPRWFCHHSSRVQGDYAWVTASGAIGLSSLQIRLAEDKIPPRRYRIRLFFSEPEPLAANQRVFTVTVQGQGIGPDVDVAAETGGPFRSLIRTVENVTVSDMLKITLSASKNASVHQTLLSGVEIVQIE